MVRQSPLQRWAFLLLLALLTSLLLYFAVPTWVYRVYRHVELARQDALQILQLEEAQRQVEDQFAALHRLSQEIPRSVVRIHGSEGWDSPCGFGVIVDPRALAVTSCTLVGERAEIPILFASGAEPLPARVIACDPLSDLAVLEFVPPFGAEVAVRQISKSPPRLGDHVFALADAADPRGSLQLGHILRRGTYSRRICLHDVDLIGTNVATDHNIGSPLFNAQGDILGICIAEHAAEDPQRGYVLPAMAADQVLSDLQHYGRVRRGWIGAFLHADVLPDSGPAQTQVAHVDYVVPGSPSERAGLRAGDDILLMTQHLPATGVPDLQRLILAMLPTEVLRVSVVRRDKYEVLSIPIETQPLLSPALPGEREWNLLLACLQEPPREDPEEPALGVCLRGVGPRLRERGIQPADVITAINGIPTPNVETWCRQASAVLASRLPVRLEIWRRGGANPRRIELDPVAGSAKGD